MNAILQQRQDFSMLGIVTIGLLLTALAAHPATLPAPSTNAACMASQAY